MEQEAYGKIVLSPARKHHLGPWQIKVSHKHYPEAKHKGTEPNPESNKFCSILIPVPSPPHTQKSYFGS